MINYRLVDYYIPPPIPRFTAKSYVVVRVLAEGGSSFEQFLAIIVQWNNWLIWEY